jgi:hypothetical protein
MEILILISLMVAVAAWVWFFESREDFWMIADSKKLHQEKWKFWGNAEAIYVIGIVSACATVLHRWQDVFLFPILIITWWITHDFAMNHRLGEKPFHIGSGKFDEFMAQIFQRSGIVYFIFGKLIWLGVFLTLYLEL